MAPELREQLQAHLGKSYTLERELGGGGMSRVFLAQEVRLGRTVVVKVLPPQMAAGVSVDRFEREIHLAAKLQHPHIVPLLTAGSAGDLLYYIMPHIEGESLRARLTHDHELPVGETVRILRDVVDALAYAHAHGIVHRDIKPDNILLSGKHALVTDFGVAKAVSESTGRTALTSMGVALGTPAYMAPEQAAADPQVDHRADLYAVGTLAYEMLCGCPPFTGTTAQAVLAAHVSRAPEPCATHRPAVPPALNALVMRCLEKHASDRWQSADELLAQLEPLVTPSGGTTPTQTAPVTAARAPRRGRVIAGLVVAAATVLGFGLWRAGAFGSRSLVAQGVLAAKEPILVADFANRTADSALGGTIAGALRVDLSQSPVMGLVSPERLKDAFARMGKPADTRLDADVARELATREGIKAVLVGDIARLGSGYTLSARLMAPASGDELAAFRETATDSTGLIGAVGRLSQAVRGRIGESIRSIQSTPPLERVTTASLPALQRYTRAVELINQGTTETEVKRGLALLEEAVTLDTGFAMAYRKLAVILSNRGERRDRVEDAMRRAMANRDRLTEAERGITMGTYYHTIDDDPGKAVAAYRGLLEIDPTNWLALNNLGVVYQDMRQFGPAVEAFRKAVHLAPSKPDAQSSVIIALVEYGRLDEARRVYDSLRSEDPQHPTTRGIGVSFEAAQGHYAVAESLARRFLEENRGNEDLTISAEGWLVQLATVQGRLAEAERRATSLAEAEARRGNPNQALFWTAYLAHMDVRLRNDPRRALSRLDAGLAKYRFAQVKPLEWPYDFITWTFAVIGQPARARQLYTATQSARKPGLHYNLLGDHYILAEIAERERRYPEAITELRLADTRGPTVLPKPHRARAFALAGMADSAILYYRAFTDTLGSLDRWRWLDPAHRAEAYQALGTLYDERGEREKAIDFYGRFVDLWKDADPELQPIVRDVSARIARLAGEH